MSRALFIAGLVCAFLGLKAQKVDNVRATASGDLIIIIYDLSGTKPDQRFRVNLFSSHNNFTYPVQQVSGDVGDNVLAGKDKRISWSARNEIRDYKGNLSFEVRADLMVPAIAPETTPATAAFTFRDVSSVKRGGIMPINWSGGTSSENVKLELLKGGVSQQSLMNSRNTGSYSWSVPADMKPGTYQVKIAGSSGTGVSSDFSIKHKIPTALKALPVVVIVAVIAASGGSKGGGGGGTPPTSGDLPDPPPP